MPNPNITHGAGPMVFSVSKTINFAKAKAYADEMVMRGYFPYNGLDKRPRTVPAMLPRL